MFQGLRQGSPIYLLDRSGEKPTLSEGRVQQVSNPTPRYGYTLPSPTGSSVESLVDVSAKVGEDNVTLKGLPAMGTIHNVTSTLVVSDSRDAMLAEVEALDAQSKKAIEDVPYHETVRAACQDMRRVLNPQIAKDEDNDKAIQSLRKDVDGISSRLDRVLELLKKP